MIRFLENILLIAGAVTLGGVANSIAVGCLAYLVLGPPKLGNLARGLESITPPFSAERRSGR
jgi:hypothetical protein